MTSLFDIATRNHSAHPATKPLSYYERYDDFLNHHHVNPSTVLEIGTFEGESTKILAEAFPTSSILTLDIQHRAIDFNNHKNITYKIVDQTDRVNLESCIMKSFPGGIDLVIEDASHLGYFSRITFEIVFPFLNAGGAYFVEDWGTGYWDDWPDGSRYESFLNVCRDASVPKRIPSHDFGMVGFVKSLVDLTHERAVKDRHNAESKYNSRLKSLEFGEGVCMMLKA